jgi:hypothetical protein
MDDFTTPDDAIARLREAGLVASVGHGPSLVISGGTRYKTVLGVEGIGILDLFTIKSANSGWVVSVSGPGLFTTQKQVGTLVEAVETVCALYKTR